MTTELEAIEAARYASDNHGYRTCNGCGGPMSGRDVIAAHRGHSVEEHRNVRPGAPWGWRVDAKFCSNACRQKAYRKRKSHA